MNTKGFQRWCFQNHHRNRNVLVSWFFFKNESVKQPRPIKINSCGSLGNLISTEMAGVQALGLCGEWSSHSILPSTLSIWKTHAFQPSLPLFFLERSLHFTNLILPENAYQNCFFPLLATVLYSPHFSDPWKLLDLKKPLLCCEICTDHPAPLRHLAIL